MFIDSHCHLSYEPMVNDIPNVLNLCAKEKINQLLTIGTNYKTSLKSIEIADNYENIYCAIGIHPSEVDNDSHNFSALKLLIGKSKKIIGIGETGLDFHYKKSDSKNQIKNFYRHIELANLNKIPVIVHTRDAEKETLEVISEEKKKNNTSFLIHCFTGSEIFSQKLLDLDCYISFSGIITFKKSDELREVVKSIPLNRMLIETDSPYLSPVPYRSKPNYPHNVKLVADEISKIKNIPIEIVAENTTKNFKNIFNISYE